LKLTSRELQEMYSEFKGVADSDSGNTGNQGLVSIHKELIGMPDTDKYTFLHCHMVKDVMKKLESEMTSRFMDIETKSFTTTGTYIAE
jgi:hypothetical protein